MPAPLLLGALLALSQGPSQESPALEVGETVVLAPRAEESPARSPAVVTTVTGDQLEATGERSLPRALARTAGVWVQETNLGGGAVVLNGFLGNRVLIVVDGVRLNDSTTRSGPNQSLNGIDPRTVDRVEVVRGPASLLYGSDAVGGAILVWTKRRAPRSRDGDPRAWRGGFDVDVGTAALGGRATLTESWAGRDQGALAIGSLQSYDDLRAGGGEVQDPSGYGGTAAFGSWELALGEHRTLRVVGRRTRDLDVPRTDRLRAGYGQTQPQNAVWDYELQDRWSMLVAYGDDEPGGLADRMEARLSLRDYTEERRIRKTGSITESFEHDRTQTVGLSVDWKRALGEGQILTWGLDADNDQVDSYRTDVDVTTGIGTPQDGAFADGSRYTSTGAFLRDELFWLDPWIVTAGLRFSYFDFAFENFPVNGGGREQGNFSALTGALSVRRDFEGGLGMTATVGQAFRAPNLDDLANNGSFAGGFEFANPDLEPEQSVTGQLSFDLRRERWGGYLGLYYTSIDELIGRTLLDPGTPPPGDETYLRDNVGTAEVFGLNLGADRRLGAADSPWSLRAQASWTYGTQRGENIDPADPAEDEVPFQRIPPLFGELGLRWEEPAPGRPPRWGELTARFAADQDRLHPQDELDPRIDPDGTPGWLVLDVDVGGPLEPEGGSRWNLGLHNLLDETYRVHASGLDAPGFQLVLGLSVSW